MTGSVSLQQLSYFAALAATRSFTRAAERCHVSQPALSQAVAALEREYKSVLVDRRRGGVVLTRAGRRLLRTCYDVLELMDKAEGDVASLQGELTGRIVAGMPTSVGFYGFSGFLKDFLKRHPKVEVVFQVQDRGVVLEKLAAGEADFGLLPDFSPRPPLAARPLFEDVWTLAAAPRWAAAARAEGLSRAPFLMMEGSDAEGRRALERAFARRGIAPKVLLQADDLETIKRMALEGWGLVALPRRMIRRECAAGTLADLSLRDFRWRQSVFLVQREGRFLSQAEETFLAELSSSAHRWARG